MWYDLQKVKESEKIHSFTPTIDLSISNSYLPEGALLGSVASCVFSNKEDVVLKLFLEAGKNYSLEHSSDMTNWQPFDPSNIPVLQYDGVVFAYDDGLSTDVHPSLVSQRFYRLVEITD